MINKKFLILKYTDNSITPEKLYLDTLIGLQRKCSKSSFVSVFELKGYCYRWCFDLNLKDLYHLDCIYSGNK